MRWWLLLCKRRLLAEDNGEENPGAAKPLSNTNNNGWPAGNV